MGILKRDLFHNVYILYRAIMLPSQMNRKVETKNICMHFVCILSQNCTDTLGKQWDTVGKRWDTLGKLFIPSRELTAISNTILYIVHHVLL